MRDPPPLLPPVPVGERRPVWLEIDEFLRRLARDAAAADDVQETLFRLYRRLGPDPRVEDAIRLGSFIPRRVRIDRLRRRCLELLGDASDRVVGNDLDPPASGISLDERWSVDPVIGRPLGPGGMRLLELIASGVRSNKALARLLGTSPCAIRRRRRRIQMLLRALVVGGDVELEET